MIRRYRFVALILGLGSACGGGENGAPSPWSRVEQSADAALTSVHGTAPDDVWFVGADDGTGPLVLHWDGNAWERRATPVHGDLWWVHAVDGGPVFMAGANANILRYEGGTFERMPTPGLGKHIVFGLWAAGSSDAYAVGSVAGRNGFIWHYDGQSWQELPLPSGLPRDEYRDLPAFFKVWGASANSVWVVGGRGVVLRGNASEGFQIIASGVDTTLFTVHAAGDRVLIVGGDNQGVILEAQGNTLVDRSPASAPLLQGVFATADGFAWATGLGGSIYRSAGKNFEPVDPGIDFRATQSLHSTWVDPAGGVWAVGGNVLSPPLAAGIAIHRGAAVPEHRIEAVTPPAPACPQGAVDPAPNASIARRWNEQLLNAIRRDVPRPTVHARNLFHTAVAMWDAWSAYDPVADGYVVRERRSAGEPDVARREAISYAAYRVLAHRYASAVGGGVSQACFNAFMAVLGYDPNETDVSGDTPRALGNRIGAAVIDAFAGDGANEASNYAPPMPYASETPNLIVDVPGTRATDPIHWQKLVIAQAVTQNGILLGSGAQDYVGPHWGVVTPFAIERPAADQPYLDIGSPPSAFDSALVDATVEEIRKSSELDIDDGVTKDISPGAYGNNPLGTNDGTGHPLNPVTGLPYAPELVKRGDFTRVLAEFWADGPKSETPPGHWNTIANSVADHPALQRTLFGSGEVLDPLSWDVHVYFALNGAVHDAAIAAWELKRVYTTARPITLIRCMAGLGQRSDPGLPSYDANGLPLVDNLIEIITEESSGPGQRHAHLARYVGEIAVRAWRGEPGDRAHDIGGVGWIRAVEWMPYQRRTFVTPAFPGYLSGHSTFSRAAATVLAGLTGSDFFPGGLGSQSFSPGYLVFEQGPTAPVELQWATYFDASDQAGQSRLWGGIHIRQDDFDGRRIGARIGAAALERARRYFDGSAVP
jgi:hypothetical protein